MFEKIMVPLDGSKLAECALPYAEKLAQSCQPSEVVLVSVTEQVKGVTTAAEAREALRGSDKANLGEAGSGISVTFGKLEGPAWKYLTRIRKKLQAKGIPAKCQVLIGSPAGQITKFAEEGEFDLIVMSSHGRTGPSRWAFGSVTDKVFRASCIPVMMIRPPGCLPGF